MINHPHDFFESSMNREYYNMQTPITDKIHHSIFINDDVDEYKSRVSGPTYYHAYLCISYHSINILTYLLEEGAVCVTGSMIYAALAKGYIDIAERLMDSHEGKISPSCLNIAIIMKARGVISKMIACGAHARDLYDGQVIDILTSSPAVVRCYVMVGGWDDRLNPHDYAFEISEKMHGSYPNLAKFLTKRSISIDSDFGDIAIMTH